MVKYQNTGEVEAREFREGAGAATRKPYDFKTFRANDDNKKQLCHLLLRVRSAQQAASRLERTEMAVLVVEGKARHLISLSEELS